MSIITSATHPDPPHTTNTATKPTTTSVSVTTASKQKTTTMHNKTRASMCNLVLIHNSSLYNLGANTNR